MSPAAALQSEIFRAYAIIVAGALLFGAIVLAATQLFSRKSIASIWQTYHGWLIIAPLAVAIVFAGRITFVAAVLVVALCAFREFARAAKLDRDRILVAVVYVAIAAVVLEPRTFTCAILAICAVPIARNSYRGELQRVAIATLAFVCLSLFTQLARFANLRNAYGFICFVIFATQVNDIAAFTFGRLLGRHPLRSEISPRKTWEGTLGAFCVSMALPWLLRFSFPQFHVAQLILAGFIVAIGALLGDLTVSLFKRELGVKDMGAAIPGHGGVFDRIDNLIFTAPLFFWLASHYDLPL
jgi:phosphatidate cytidylyltransferase